MSLIQDRDLVEGIIQETNLVHWRKFCSFEIGTNFTAWSCRMAENQMRAWEKQQQGRRYSFDDFSEVVASELDSHPELSEPRL